MVEALNPHLVAAASRAKQKIRDRYEPTGNVHADGDYVSVSGLVKKSAHLMARDLLKKREGVRSEDRVPRYYSYLGNTLGDEALRDAVTWEIHVNHPLGVKSARTGEEWSMQGHFDGVDVVDDFVFLLEHKAHLNVLKTHMQIAATRQAALYLSMMYRNVTDGRTRVFNPAPWAPPEAKPFMWEETYEPGGVIVCIAPSKPSPITDWTYLSPEELQATLSFYENKSMAIVTAVEEGDLGIARAWDEGDFGIVEDLPYK